MNIAIILSGCGNRDGSELQETLSLMLAIDRRNWHYQCFSPEGVFDVVDHFTGNEDGSQRDLFAESARIARGSAEQNDHSEQESQPFFHISSLLSARQSTYFRAL